MLAHLKSSKCQNFLKVWHLVIFRASQKTTLYIVLYSNYVHIYFVISLPSHGLMDCYNVLHWRSTLYNTKKYKMWIKIMFWNSDWIQTKNTIVSLQKTPQNTGHLLIVVVLPSERLQFHCITIENTCHLFAALRFRP